jgi:3-hydroxyacyl-[acyl-carrier-protein] dehydratase
MMIDDLYSYEITNHIPGNEIEATIVVNEKSSIYAGHFPDFPITPGVCQLLMIKEILAEELNTPLKLSRAKVIKFTAMHQPGKVKKISAKISFAIDTLDVIEVKALLYDGETKFLNFKGEFIKQAEGKYRSH